MIKNNGEIVKIRELYKLLEGVEERINKRLDMLEQNHIQHLSDRITSLERKVWFTAGGVSVLSLILKFLIK